MKAPERQQRRQGWVTGVDLPRSWFGARVTTVLGLGQLGRPTRLRVGAAMEMGELVGLD
jgi:hypothetical protein